MGSSVIYDLVPLSNWKYPYLNKLVNYKDIDQQSDKCVFCSDRDTMTRYEVNKVLYRDYRRNAFINPVMVDQCFITIIV